MSQPSTSTTEKWWAYLFAICILGIAAVTVSLISSTELPQTIIGALLGVAMTVFATYFLFKGQSKQQVALLEQQSRQQVEILKQQNIIEREQEKDSETFKQRLSTYNNFLNSLCAYVTDSTEKNKKSLIFHTMAIRMHAAPGTVQPFVNSVSKIIQVTGNKEKSEISDLINTLNDISSLFHTELYGANSGTESVALQGFIDAITNSLEEPSENEKIQENIEDEKEDEAAMATNIPGSWDAKVKELEAKGWKLTSGNDSITLESASTPVVISVNRKKGKYAIEASKEGDNDFSQNLKDSFGGARRYGTWWRELPISNYGVKGGTLLAQLPVNDRARTSVVKWIDKLLDSGNI
ncbi:MAG: hypothetical protein K2K47_07995 [Duncaniella sp.]|nr:hypothetical protein [Duncaniella sp.]